MKQVLIYESFFEEEAKLMGTLFIDSLHGTEHQSFEYNREWLLSHNRNFVIDPDIAPVSGRQYPNRKTAFGVFSDSAPDRWGKTLMDRRERIRAGAEGRKPSKLYASDYLLGVYDESRMGALQYKANRDGPFLSDDLETAAPPWTTLRTLETATYHFENDETSLQEKWLNQLIRPGSSLGGARPKATVTDPSGELWIAKFPSRKDDINVGAWEKTAYDLAGACGLNVAPSELETFSKQGSTFLVKRFDREKGRRIHFASAMTMLGKTDGDSGESGVSYIDIADFIRANGAEPKRDLAELWRRMVFNMAITNSDDHLRNHGFLLTKKGWILSPVYDINPVPYGNSLSLNVDDVSNEISAELAMSVAPFFGLSTLEAEKYLFEIAKTVKSLYSAFAAKNGISRSSIEYMRPAFSFCDIV